MGKKKGKKLKDNSSINKIFPHNFTKKDCFYWPTIYYKNILKNINSFKDLLISNEEDNYLDSLINNLDLEIEPKKEIINISPLFKEIIEKMELKKRILSEESSNIQNIINNFPHSKTFYIKDISAEYVQKFNKKLSRNKIYNILKNSLKYSFLKTSIKPSKINSDRGQIMSFIFYKTLIRGLSLGLQPIYIDESGFQLLNNKYYRWRKRDEEFPYGSDCNILSKSNMILAVSDKDILIYQINKENTNSAIFSDFVKEMLKKIPESEKENKLIIMDNAKFHLSDDIKKLFKDNKIKVLTISPYNSDQNMCELVFRHLKFKTRQFFFKTHKKMIENLENILEDENTSNIIKKLFKRTLLYYQNFIKKNNDWNLIKKSFKKVFEKK